MSKKPTKSRRTPPSPERLAAQFVDGESPIDLQSWIEAHMDEWKALERAVQKRDWPHCPTVKQRLAMEHRVMDALPSEMHKAFIEYSDAYSPVIGAASDAAFILGLQIGLRLVGGGL